MKPIKIFALMTCFLMACPFAHAVPYGSIEKHSTDKVFSLQSVDQVCYEIAPVVSFPTFDLQNVVFGTVSGSENVIGIGNLSCHWIYPLKIGDPDSKQFSNSVTTTSYNSLLSNSSRLSLDNHSFQPAIAASVLRIDADKRNWFIPWQLGKTDTKRHFSWLSFVRKLC